MYMYLYLIHIELPPRIALIHFSIHGTDLQHSPIDFSQGFLVQYLAMSYDARER